MSPAPAGTRAPAGAEPLVPLHPESTGDPATVRWRVPAGLLPFVGPVEAAPDSLGILHDAGVLAALVVEPDAVVTSLRDADAWRSHGAEVRGALHEALAQPARWRPGGHARKVAPVERIRAAAEAVLAGPVGAFIASHGGAVRLVGVDGGEVLVDLAGACRGCPAAAFTLHLRLERELRARCAEVTGVRCVGDDPGRPGPSSRRAEPEGVGTPG